ncbi:hypothetical protein B5M09_012639 [Aphanomyces astaci]|uniref:DDE Tnp4 domain-containing protein n=1 Tax=Aphanomyces astaci TaxID=112090 RepID=A0A425DLZ6_APHAT|nr:hypothetical protein B5M09_012639 [Aphanomyces astaci]
MENLDQQRYAKRARYSTVLADEPNDLDSNSLIYNSFLASEKSEVIVTITHFSPSEFNLIWREVRQYVFRHWNAGCGQKSMVSARGLLMMLFTSLKHSGTCDVGAAVFKQKPRTFEKRVMSFLTVLHPYLMRTFIAAVEQKWPMKAHAESGHRFKNFTAARYATDNFSGKHSLDEHKVEVSMVPNGFAIDCTKFYKGSVSEKTIFDENIDPHLAKLAKRTGERTLKDSEPGMEQWAVLADKGYQGIRLNHRAVLPLRSR